MKVLFSFFSMLLLVACTAVENFSEDRGQESTTLTLSALDVSQPESWDEDLAMVEPEDINPDPNILEIELEAKITDMEIVPGTITSVWTYGGSLPGPLIKAKVGDRIIIHFKNLLPDSTSIHWHGMRLGNDMDGVPGVTQDPVPVDGEFTYDFIARDAGTYWYHPHINSAAQVGWGMYGAMIIEDPNDPEEFGDDLVILLSDMSLDAEGQFLPPKIGGAFGDLFGREGEILLVNGKVMPRLRMRQGKQQRWRVINAARTRYYTLRYKRSPLVKLGGDNGLAARTQMVDQIVLVPGERADFVFTPPDAPGTQDALRWYPTERGYGSTFNRFSENIMVMETVNAPAVEPVAIPEVLREIERIDISNAVELDLELTIAFTRDDQVEMGINGIPYKDMVPIEAQIGQTHVWTVSNNSDFAHPFHLHGYFFQVVDDNRVAEWKDTIDVPVNTEIKLAVKFDERPGVWMYHCHILDHAEVGMMGQLKVVP